MVMVADQTTDLVAMGTGGARPAGSPLATFTNAKTRR